jgi:hypothetical protein
VVAAIELQEQLHAREGQLDSREGGIAMRVDGLVAFMRAPREVIMECDAKRVQAKVV